MICLRFKIKQETNKKTISLVKLKPNMNRSIFIVALLALSIGSLTAQNTGSIQGKIVNKQNNEPVPFANIVIWGTNIGASSDFDGNFLFTGLQPGFVELRVFAIGFSLYISSSIQVTNARTAFIEIQLEETATEIEGVVVKASPFRRSEESPVSLQRIGIAEIEKNPGGNRDISKVIQSLPGVASTPAYRNDVIVRGGAQAKTPFTSMELKSPTLTTLQHRVHRVALWEL